MITPITGKKQKTAPGYPTSQTLSDGELTGCTGRREYNRWWQLYIKCLRYREEIVI